MNVLIKWQEIDVKAIIDEKVTVTLKVTVTYQKSEVFLKNILKIAIMSI
jgi:hypothetical protein